jgi:hypothetical protein
MLNERMEFYDDNENDRIKITLDQFINKLSLELGLNSIDSNYYEQNFDIVLSQIQIGEVKLKEKVVTAFSEKNKKIYLLTSISIDGFTVQEIGYNNFPINSKIQKYDELGNLESNN